MPESPTESAQPQGASPEPPPLGKPIHDDPSQPDGQDSFSEHVVVTPQTAGSAGTAPKES